MKNLHTPTNQPSPFYPDTGKDRRSPLGLTKFVDISGIEPEVLELTPVDWTSHPTKVEHFLTREYTLCDVIVYAGLIYLKRVPVNTWDHHVS